MLKYGNTGKIERQKGRVMKPTDRNVYHIFTLGYCGAPTTGAEEQETVNRIEKVSNIVDYLKDLNINTVLFGPLNESVSHGYDTIDYNKVDHRLGTQEDLKKVVDELHENDIEVLFDCVFNHVGRDHFAFQDLKQNRENSRYKDWFLDVNFWGNNGYNDGFSYANWAGHDELVKLNLWNPEVKEYLKNNINNWIELYDIDGVRMDAANVMNREFLAELSDFAKSKKDDFMLIGEIVGGDYSELARNGHLDTITNYECYKGLYSSLNDKNYFEIAHSIRRLFDQGGIIYNIPAANFADNHDVERVATTIRDKRLLKPLYLLLYTMPGFPNIYYGSEQAIEGKKGWGTDAPLRPPYENIDFDKENELYKFISELGKIREENLPLREGIYREMFIRPEQYGFFRIKDNEETAVLLNMNENDQDVNTGLHGKYEDLLNDEILEIQDMVSIPAFSGRILKRTED